jgi:hypothetical protein
MDLFFFIFVCGALAGIVIPGILIYYLVESTCLADKEHGLKPIYREQCGGRFDLFNATIPLVRFAIYEEFLVAVSGPKKYVIDFDDIQDVSVQRHFVFKGVHIRHFGRIF